MTEPVRTEYDFEADRQVKMCSNPKCFASEKEVDICSLEIHGRQWWFCYPCYELFYAIFNFVKDGFEGEKVQIGETDD